MGRRHRQFRNRRGSRFCPAEPSRGVPRAVLGVDRLARCVVAVCRPARRRAQSPPYGLMGCTGRRSRAPQCNGRGDGRNAAISAAADTSVAPGAFVSDASVTEASSPEVATPAPGDSSVGDTLSAAIVSAPAGASPASDPHVASPCAAGQQVSSRPLAQHPVPAARLTAQGAVALLAAVAAQNEENRQAVLRAAGSLGKLPAEDYVHEELAWRLEA